MAQGQAWRKARHGARSGMGTSVRALLEPTLVCLPPITQHMVSKWVRGTHMGSPGALLRACYLDHLTGALDGPRNLVAALCGVGGKALW